VPDACPLLSHLPGIILPVFIAPVGLVFPGPDLLSGTINLNLGCHEWMDINILMLFLPPDVSYITQQAHSNTFL